MTNKVKMMRGDKYFDVHEDEVDEWISLGWEILVTDNSAPSVMQNEFTCENCGGTWTKGRSDEVARTEYDEQFSDYVSEDATIVCDDCYKKIMTWHSSQA